MQRVGTARRTYAHARREGYDDLTIFVLQECPP
jgi:hypothetical protein